jgi:hypothetical protein
MNRIKDYTSFAIWFAGLGYIVLWPLTAPEWDGRPFGTPIFCRDNSLSTLDLLCNSAHSLPLPPGLHALGFMAAVFVTTRLLYFAVWRSRRSAGAEAANSPAAPVNRIQIAMLQPPKRKAPPRPPLRSVKPRNHFGLRGMPH